MNCDNAMMGYATGRWFQRWLARRHARGCAGCASVMRSLDELQRQTPLPPPDLVRQRQAWLSVAEDEPPMLPRQKIAWQWGIALAAVLLIVVALFQILERRPPQDDRAPQKVAAAVVGPIQRVDVADELTQLKVKLEQLAKQIELVSHDVDRVTALHETTRLIAEYKPR